VTTTRSSSGACTPSRDLTEEVASREPETVMDDFGLLEFMGIARNYGWERYGYVVTPNVDHLVRYHEDPCFRAHYSAADFILMDSRFAARLVLLLKGIRIAVCTGSDLTARLLANVTLSTDRIVIIGGSVVRRLYRKTHPTRCTRAGSHRQPRGATKVARARRDSDGSTCKPERTGQ